MICLTPVQDDLFDTGKQIRSCVKSRYCRGLFQAPVPNKPTVSVDVKQHSANTGKEGFV